tara:strand:- start:719 stop:1042 length:324 start_codon:yes stop_codon:yes gene_type:complete
MKKQKYSDFVCAPDTMKIRVMDAVNSAVTLGLLLKDKHIFKGTYMISDLSSEQLSKAVTYFCNDLIELEDYDDFEDWVSEEEVMYVKHAAQSIKHVYTKLGLLIWSK